MIILSKFRDFWKEQFDEAFGGKISEGVNEALEPKFVDFFGLEVDPSVFTAIIVTMIIVIAGLIFKLFIIPKFQKEAKGVQLVLESVVGYFSESSEKTVHDSAGIVGPYICASAIYIALATLIELIGLRPSFASINACFSMGIMSFIIINICSFRKKKLRRLKRYINPLNIVTDLSVPFSMSLRLFGSILSGFIIMELLYSIVYTSFIIPAAVALLTTLLHAFLQAYLFATLTNIFVSEAIE